MATPEGNHGQKSSKTIATMAGFMRAEGAFGLKLAIKPLRYPQ
jgi:hypothetical protein